MNELISRSALEETGDYPSLKELDQLSKEYVYNRMVSGMNPQNAMASAMIKCKIDATDSGKVKRNAKRAEYHPSIKKAMDELASSKQAQLNRNVLNSASTSLEHMASAHESIDIRERDIETDIIALKAEVEEFNKAMDTLKKASSDKVAVMLSDDYKRLFEMRKATLDDIDKMTKQWMNAKKQKQSTHDSLMKSNVDAIKTTEGSAIDNITLAVQLTGDGSTVNVVAPDKEMKKKRTLEIE